jgi:hypothetical protein
LVEKNIFFVQRIILKEKYLEELLETNFLGRKTIFLSKCKMKKKTVSGRTP